MDFINRKKTMFQVTAKGAKADYIRLIDYCRWCIENDIGEKVARHKLFAPSGVWSEWSAETFLGFSTRNIILQSGHTFPIATRIGTETLVNESGSVKSIVREIMNMLRGTARGIKIFLITRHL